MHLRPSIQKPSTKSWLPWKEPCAVALLSLSPTVLALCGAPIGFWYSTRGRLCRPAHTKSLCNKMATILKLLLCKPANAIGSRQKRFIRTMTRRQRERESSVNTSARTLTKLGTYEEREADSRPLELHLIRRLLSYTKPYAAKR